MRISRISLSKPREALRSPAFLGSLSLAAVVAVFGGVTAAHAGVHPDKNFTCNKTGVCQNIRNSGPALQVVTSNANTRALYVYATNSGADGSDITGGYIGIIGRAPAGGGTYPLTLTDQNGNDLDFTDGNGDIFYHGSLNGFSHTRNGLQVMSYAPTAATPTMEDVGSSQLVNGRAVVALDRTFAQAIDGRSAYQVFLTPTGDTRGLYVAQKTAVGFVVRETQGGRGSLGFDYRIVAAPAGRAGQRMGLTKLPAEPNSH